MILFQYIRKYYLIFRFKELIRGIVCIIIILYRGNKMATEFLIACILFTIQIIEILRAKILKQILLRLFCRERVGITWSDLQLSKLFIFDNKEPIDFLFSWPFCFLS